MAFTTALALTSTSFPESPSRTTAPRTLPPLGGGPWPRRGSGPPPPAPGRRGRGRGLGGSRRTARPGRPRPPGSWAGPGRAAPPPQGEGSGLGRGAFSRRGGRRASGPGCSRGSPGGGRGGDEGEGFARWGARSITTLRSWRASTTSLSWRRSKRLKASSRYRTPVEELGGAGARPRGEVPRLHQSGLEAPKRGLPQDPGPRGPAPQDEEVKGLLQPFQEGFPVHYPSLAQPLALSTASRHLR